MATETEEVEQQEFMMQITEISNGAGQNNRLTDLTISLMKEAIRSQALKGLRQFNINRPMFNINMGGIVLSLPINLAITYFREQGFNIEEQANLFLISW